MHLVEDTLEAVDTADAADTIDLVDICVRSSFWMVLVYRKARSIPEFSFTYTQYSNKGDYRILKFTETLKWNPEC